MFENEALVDYRRLGSENGGRSEPAPVDGGDDVERIRSRDSEVQRTLEPNVTTAIVGLVLDRAGIRILAGNEEVASRIDLTVPGHARDLRGIAHSTGKEFRRRTGFDSAIVFATDKPTPFELGNVDTRVLVVRLGAVVISRIGIGLAGFGIVERRREVRIEFGSHRVLLELAADLAPKIATITFGDDVHVERPILLEPRIVDELIPGLGRSDETETLVERLTVATGLTGTFVRRHTDFIFRDRSELEQLLERESRGSRSHISDGIGKPRGGLGTGTNWSFDEALACDVDVRRPIPDVGSVKDVLEHPNLGLDVLARWHQIALHEVLIRRKEPEVRRGEILPVQDRIGRALVDVKDILERILGDPVRPGLLPNERRLFDLHDPHGVTHVGRPFDRIGQQRSKDLPALPCFSLGFDEVIRKFVVLVLILFRPHVAEILIDGRKRL